MDEENRHTWRVSRKSAIPWRLLRKRIAIPWRTISKICHTLAIIHGDKPSAPLGKGYTPAAVVHTAEPSGECGKHTAENYANYEALHLMKSTDETGRALLSPVRSAAMQNNLQNTRKLQFSLQSDSVLNGNSEAQTSYSDKQLRLSAVIDEGKGAVALTMTSALLYLRHRSLACSKCLTRRIVTSLRSLLHCLPCS